MPLVKSVEKKIWDIEEFAVTIKHSDGRDMRGDRQGLPQYNFERAAPKSMAVSAWKDHRFHPTYIGLEIDVLDGTGQAVAGNMLLSSVHDSYED